MCIPSANPSLSISEILDLWEYDPETGIFKWRVWKAGMRRDRTTGHSDGRYIVLAKNRKKFYAHRVAFVAMLGRWPGQVVDHINGDCSDNKWVNLREATQGQNIRNKDVKGDSLTGVKGVSRDKRDGRFYAYIDVNGKRTALGGFENADDARRVRREAEIALHEGFAFGDLAAPTRRKSKPHAAQSVETPEV
jgi:hypothetical protein